MTICAVAFKRIWRLFLILLRMKSVEKHINQKKDYLGQVSQGMARIHKLLLENEIEFIERKNGIALNANDRLQVLLNSAELAWLRDLSQTMVYVDDIYFQKEEIENEQIQTVKERVENLMLQSNESEFSKKYTQLMTVVPDLMLEHGRLKVAIKNSPL